MKESTTACWGVPICAVLLFAAMLGAVARADEVFSVGEQNFILDAKPFVIRSGEMHYPRIPREYWQHRLRMARAMGLNTVSTYGFWNLHEPPQPTSYDYDAPISEAGWDTPKFYAVRELLAKHLEPGNILPDVPKRNPVIQIPPIDLSEVAPLLANLPKAKKSTHPQCMEFFDQGEGCILYRTKLPKGGGERLVIRELHDYAVVVLDGKKIATLDRGNKQDSVVLPARKEESTLDLLAEAMGRINFGEGMYDRKGITEKVELVTGSGSQRLLGWEVFNLPLDRQQLSALNFQRGQTDLPGFYRGRFNLREVGDTFLDVRNWGKGVVWVNGHNLGRFWAVGPQQTLYCPGPWLKKGANELVILELNGAQKHSVAGLIEPILNELNPEATGRTHRKQGQALNLADLRPVHSGSFAPGGAWQELRFTPTKGRYLCLEALNSYPNDEYSTCAELELLGPDSKALAGHGWKIVYADSEEVLAEDGGGDNVLDSRADTFWHTQWGAAKPKHPHQLVIDLGREESIAGLRYLPRQDKPNGQIRDFRVFVSAAPFPGPNRHLMAQCLSVGLRYVGERNKGDLEKTTKRTSADDIRISGFVRHSVLVIRHFLEPLDATSAAVRLWPRLARDPVGAVANELFATVVQTPAVQSLQRRLEKGGAVSCAGVCPSAQPFLSALLRHLFPHRPVVVVTAGLKTQEGFHQDIATWLQVGESSAASPGGLPQPSTLNPQPLFYPAWETLPHEAKPQHADVISARLETLIALSQSVTRDRQPAPLVVVNVVAMLQRTFPPDQLERRTRCLARGERFDPLDLTEWLEEQGYEPEAQVTQKCEIALRGGILDVYPPTSPWPVRLEFFGSELESLRYFDPLTQISREELPTITLAPAGELGILKRQLPVSFPSDQGNFVKTADDGQRTEDPAPTLSTLLDYLPRETLFLLCEPEALREHAGHYAQQVPDGDPFFASWEAIQAGLAANGMTVLEVCESEFSATGAEIIEPLDKDAIHFDPEQPATRNPQPTPLLLSSLAAFRPLSDRAPEPQVAEAQRREFFAQLHRWLRQGHAVHVFCNNEGERQRFHEIWEDYGFGKARQISGLPRTSRRAAPLTELPAGQEAADSGRSRDARPALHLGALRRGFVFDEARLVVVTDAEIFGRYKVHSPRRLKTPRAAAMRSALDINFTELEEGDYVVHLQHGIGRYRGLKMLPLRGQNRLDQSEHETHAQPLQGGEPGIASPDAVLLPGGEQSIASPKPVPLRGGVRGGLVDSRKELTASPPQRQEEEGQECLVIEYAATDPDQPPPKLYVPVTEAHLVSKYVGAGRARPPLNTLGGTRWGKTKAQAEKAVRDLAGELLSIQAARELQPGHAFAPDSPWQREFEGAFIYEETPDQIRAILETKADLERPKPMDRLICGDVGFGKTEVAIRAAFKAVMDGRQVALLVPTTVLAQQHFNTFGERMADYPVRIELLSRFRTRRQQERVIKDLGSGAVDIVIGTHRLVQDDVGFKDLGLVIIDEEQRFGVMQKEKFKLLRKLVDVLTLSATPIPRTLYLALTGARDMSTIETPPQDRLPVETIVTQYDERVIRDAIQREQNRGGQVFYLHNRVMTIDTVAQKLKALVPQARIVVGHGQMHSDDLEEVMTQFVNGEADVLLSTTIIESGLDIPNANTIIIDRADRFGLSDLYQLRGRVGRYKHQAYAYLLLPRHAGLLTDARKRISAIKQYSTLGSGFKIAMRDLEIRGAGNLLGAEQSGHITAVGFELYCQLLKQSVSALKGEKVKPRLEVQVRFDFLALNPGEDSSGFPGPLSSAVAGDHGQVTIDKASAYIPFGYISDSRQRIDVYRRLAQATDKESLESLRRELRDRFGPLPRAIDLLLQVSGLKILASEHGIVAIETKEDKLMLTRNNDYITLAGKFPRLTRQEPKARLNEVRRLLLAL